MEPPRPTEPWSKPARLSRTVWLVLAVLLALILTMIYTREHILQAVARAKHDGNIGDIEACTQVAQAMAMPVETICQVVMEDQATQEAA